MFVGIFRQSFFLKLEIDRDSADLGARPMSQRTIVVSGRGPFTCGFYYFFNHFSDKTKLYSVPST